MVDAELPETEHDFTVDLIVTPSDVIRCGPPRRPGGIVLSHLNDEKAAQIPVLAAYAAEPSRDLDRRPGEECRVRHGG